MRLKLPIFVPLAAMACGISASNAALIATESFSSANTPVGGQYDDGPLFSQSPNTDVIVGNTGFNTTNTWSSGTSILRPADDVPVTGGLTHSLVTGTVASGAVRIRDAAPTNARSAQRDLASTAPLSANYYLSGLVSAASNFSANNESFSMGMSPGFTLNSNNISSGFHLGMFRDGSGDLRLGGFAGGTTIDLGAATLNTTYMLVLGLSANAGGLDTLDAWVAADGAALTQVVTGQSLETFSAVGDVSTLVLQSNGANSNTSWADEMRFGTEFTDVVVVVPEPSTSALFGLVAGLGLLRRRRK